MTFPRKPGVGWGGEAPDDLPPRRRPPTPDLLTRLAGWLNPTSESLPLATDLHDAITEIKRLRSEIVFWRGYDAHHLDKTRTRLTLYYSGADVARLFHTITQKE